MRTMPDAALGGRRQDHLRAELRMILRRSTENDSAMTATNG